MGARVHRMTIGASFIESVWSAFCATDWINGEHLPPILVGGRPIRFRARVTGREEKILRILWSTNGFSGGSKARIGSHQMMFKTPPTPFVLRPVYVQCSASLAAC